MVQLQNASTLPVSQFPVCDITKYLTWHACRVEMETAATKLFD